MHWWRLFAPETPLWEIFIRGTVMYLTIFVMLRAIFKRESGGTAITDLLVVVMLADAAQNGLSGNYQSITDGVALVGTIIGWSALLNALAWRFPRIERILRPRPLVLVRNGRLVRENMAKELITDSELYSQLRQQGVTRLRDVRTVRMEPDGRISVTRQDGLAGGGHG
jgi:uncharacterized membrane protein YcaP (DUF421 family)